MFLYCWILRGGSDTKSTEELAECARNVVAIPHRCCNKWQHLHHAVSPSQWLSSPLIKASLAQIKLSKVSCHSKFQHTSHRSQESHKN